MDFFSGSGTTAQAVMELNAEDGGKRKFICVQLPELLANDDFAFIDGYKTIPDIAKERIRRAGKQIAKQIEKDTLFDNKEELDKQPDEIAKEVIKYQLEKVGKNKINLANKTLPDIGFRVLKLDSSCMKDIYYSPSEITQGLLFGLEDNIKEDRTAEDLLFQVMLDMGVILSSEIKTLDICAKKVFNVNDGNLVCCFDTNLTDEVVTEIAKMQPLYAVFRDSSMSTDSVAVNFDQIFETYSPTTTRKVL
jgi:adenine-specific DNA-methyltransferase